MEDLTQQQIDTLIQAIYDAEEPRTVTNVMVATILAFLSDRIQLSASASDLAQLQSALDQLAAQYNLADNNLTRLQNALDTLMSGDATDAIESFQEVISFLSEVTDDETLTGLLNAIHSRLNNAENSLESKISKNSDTGKLDYSQAPTVMLASMGRDIDNENANNATAQETYIPSAGDTIFDPVAGKIVFYKTSSSTVSWNPNPGLIYGNKRTGYLYQWKSGKMTQVGGSEQSLTSGTYAEAWARSKVVSGPFCFLWTETVGGVAIRKPIWHVGNSVFVDAAGGVVSVASGSAPNGPTFSQEGGSVSSGTVITITPFTGSVLHYIVNGGDERTSAGPVTVAINQARVVIEAWCENAAGSSSHLTQTYTANAPAAPVLSINGSQVTSNQIITRNTVVTITATEGTLHYKVNDGQTQNPSGLTATVTCSGDTTKIETWTERDSLSSTHTVITFSVAKPNAPTVEGTTAGSTVVSRGGSVTIRGVAGGKLCYTINDATPAVEVNPVGDGVQTATVSIATNMVNGQMKIEAWNVKDGEASDHTTETFTMAALAAPVFSKTGQLDENEKDITITNQYGSGVTVYYTEDGSDPDNTSTPYTGAIRVESSKTIKAIAYDDYGHSEVTTAVFSIPVVQRFVYKISVPAAGVSDIRPPFSANGELYLCKVDWGDGTSTNIENNGAARTFNTGSHKHTYTGTGEIREVTIKITGIGDSAPIVPAIQFLVGNDAVKPGTVVEIVENSLACATAFGKIQCPNLRSICANALANNSARVACFNQLGANLSTPLELPNGLLNHLTTNANGLSSCTQMFQGAKVKITSQQMGELKGMITNVTSFDNMFKEFKGEVTIPENFFADLAGGVTTLKWMFMNIDSGATVIGDALDIYSDLSGYDDDSGVIVPANSKLAENAVVTGALAYTGFYSDWATSKINKINYEWRNG